MKASLLSLSCGLSRRTTHIIHLSFSPDPKQSLLLGRTGDPRPSNSPTSAIRQVFPGGHIKQRWYSTVHYERQRASA